VGEWRGRLRALAVDLTPLRVYRDFRLRTLAQAVSALGSAVTMIAAPIQIKQLTESTVAVGLVGAAEFAPLVVFGLLGGAVADRHDRRTVAVSTEIAAAACSALLLGNALLPSPQLWPIYLVAALSVTAVAIQRPSVEAMVPRQVAHADLAAASAVSHSLWIVAGILGPSLGGLLAATSLPWAYGVDVASFAAAVAIMLRMRPIPVTDADRPPGWRASLLSIHAGLAYARSRHDLLATYLVDTIAMTMAMPLALFPFFAGVLHSDRAVGLLYTAESVGALLASGLSGWVGRVHRHGLAIIVAAATWGGAIGLAGLMPSLPWVLGLLVLAGAADMVSGLFRGTMWNQTIPDELRGRLAGIELLSYSIGPTLGNARAGLMAVRSVRFSIAVGGALCVAGILGVAALVPHLRRYDDRTDLFAVAERERRSAAE